MSAFDDDVGMFWQAVPKKRGPLQNVYGLRAMPESNWTPPTELPSIRNQGIKRISFDVETHDEDLPSLGPGTRRGSYVVGLALGVPDGRRWYFPVRHEGGGNMD